MELNLAISRWCGSFSLLQAPCIFKSIFTTAQNKIHSKYYIINMKIISPWKKYITKLGINPPKNNTLLLWEVSVINFTAKEINTLILFFSDRIWEARAWFLVFLFFSPENVKHTKKEYLKLLWERYMAIWCILLIPHSSRDWEASKPCSSLKYHNDNLKWKFFFSSNILKSLILSKYKA